MTTSGPVRIVHCDDSPSFQMLFRHWLEDHEDLDVVGAALDVRGAIETVRALQPDVIVTDTFGYVGDPSYVEWLTDAAPAARIVIFTGYTATQLHPATVELADRVVTKDYDETALVEALRGLSST